MIAAPISADLFGASLHLTGTSGQCEFAWNTKSAHVLAYLLCNENDCDWVGLLTAVWGDATSAARNAYHTLQSTLNKRLSELHPPAVNALSVSGNNVRLSLVVQPTFSHLLSHIKFGGLYSLDQAAEEELDQCEPDCFLAGLNESWTNGVRSALLLGKQRLTQPKWDALFTHSSQLHAGHLKQMIDDAKSDLTFVVMDANEMVLACERSLLAALSRGVTVRFLVFDVAAGIKPEDARHNVMLDDAGLSRGASGTHALAALRAKWTGDSGRLRIQLYPWTPLSRIYIMDGNSPNGRLVIVPYVPSRHSPELPAFCLSWKTAGPACAEYRGAVEDMLASPALRDLVTESS